MRPIFLIGFMGTGKTTLGRALARIYQNLRFVDLDEEVERKFGVPVAQIFDTRGEEAFRHAEEAALRAVAADSDVIVACGGGTPCRSANMELMLNAGTVVNLQADRVRLLRRLAEAAGQRPLLAGLSDDALAAEVEAVYAARAPYYSRAHASFDATFLETEDEIAATCRRFARQFITTNPTDNHGNTHPA